MQRRLCSALLAAALAPLSAMAAPPHDAHLGVIDALGPRLSAGFGKAADAAQAPTIRDEWQLGKVAQEQAVMRLAALGYRATAAQAPAALVERVRNGGALRTQGIAVRLDTAFSRALERWMREQKLDGVVVLRSLARPLAQGAPAQSGYGIARRGEQPVAYANLAPLLILGASPKIDGAPQCLVTEPVDAALIARPKSPTDLEPLGPALKEALRKAVDGALIRSGVMPGDAACE